MNSVNNSEYYKQKYLKYKFKYLNLKKYLIYGGTIPDELGELVMMLENGELYILTGLNIKVIEKKQGIDKEVAYKYKLSPIDNTKSIVYLNELHFSIITPDYFDERLIKSRKDKYLQFLKSEQSRDFPISLNRQLINNDI